MMSDLQIIIVFVIFCLHVFFTLLIDRNRRKIIRDLQARLDAFLTEENEE